MSTADTSTETSAEIRPGTAIRDPLAGVNLIRLSEAS
jgi:hypothetical protein